MFLNRPSMPDYRTVYTDSLARGVEARGGEEELSNRLGILGREPMTCKSLLVSIRTVEASRAK